MEHNTIIIGAGPAGIAAAIQLKRASIDFTIIEKGAIGGLLLNANLVENYPGMSKAISGPQLVGRFREHLDSLKIISVIDEVIKVDLQESPSPARLACEPQARVAGGPNPSHQGRGTIFTIYTKKTSYACRNLIIASGTKPKRLDDLQGDNVFYEVYPLRDTKGRDITVIGSGDAAFDYALNLAKKNNVRILMRGNEPKCLPLLYERVREEENIEILTNSPSPPPATRACGSQARRAGQPSPLRGEGDIIVVAIGRGPNIDFLPNDSLEKRPVKGLYYAGDVMRGSYRQVAIAVGDGVKAAMDIISTCREMPNVIARRPQADVAIQ